MAKLDNRYLEEIQQAAHKFDDNTHKGVPISIYPCRIHKTLTRTAVVVAAIAVVGMPTASASPQDDLWNLVNSKHVSAGCAPYTGSQALMEAAVDIAKFLANPPRGIVFGPASTEQRLAEKGYFVTIWGEARYVNSDRVGSPQAAMDFWMNNKTRDIFPNCGMQNMAVAVWIQNGKWAAVALAGSPGGTPPKQPIVN